VKFLNQKADSDIRTFFPIFLSVEISIIGQMNAEKKAAEDLKKERRNAIIAVNQAILKNIVL